MDPGGIFETIASLVGLSILAIGLAAVGQALRDGLDALFGAQMRHQFPPDDVQ
jgi:hypothetical protein